MKIVNLIGFNHGARGLFQITKEILNHWEKLDDYTGLVIKILEECYADGRPPTEADMFMIDTFWNGD